MKNENGDGIFVTPSGEEASIPQPDQTLNLAEGDSLDRSEGEPPIGEEIPEAAKGQGGYSNTPHTSPKINTCIDYLKFRFDVGYGEQPGFFSKLFQVLAVEPEEFGKGGVFNNYLHHIKLGVGAILAYGGTLTINANGQNTTLLELKGQACRRFEDRKWTLDPEGKEKGWDKAITGYWLELLQLVKFEMNGTCTRIDLPTDSLDGFITADDVREKVKTREYTTTMRRLELTDDSEAPELEMTTGQSKSLMGVATVRDSKLSGYTATFGTRKSVQLCIYDKAAEQRLKTGNTDFPSWVRFEVRYYHDAAEQEILPLIKAMEKEEAQKHILQCLATAIDFKEPNTKDVKHRGEAKRWEKWDTLLKGTPKGSAFATVRGSFGIESNMNWLAKEAAKSFARVSMAYGIHPDIIGRLLVEKGCLSLNASDYQMINEYREKIGKRKINDCGPLLYWCMNPETGAIDCPPALEKYFIETKKKRAKASFFED